MLIRHCELASVKKFQTGDQPTRPNNKNTEKIGNGHNATTINQI